ncbi:hypothetical protein C922_02783 [Plasmodium inui San Antonio 1]|uniref:GAF domain-containing protein n=1 Tax=Plasmodium inui San Antonio 1 TaxID=1237626 RepID=W7A6F2_9APIC|nr:hypothetical protein C922_02783 [Plasmodium inui San Antonio 1]EUD66798.1 hypothetical protein C922_02783 [Plasmodium inui San Antonio 1]
MNERILKNIWKCEPSCLLSKSNFNASLVSTFKISRSSTLLLEGKHNLVILARANHHGVVRGSKERNDPHREKNELLDDGAHGVCAGGAHNNRGSCSGEGPPLKGTQHYAFRFDKGARMLRAGRNRDSWKNSPVSSYSTVRGRKDEREGGQPGKKDADDDAGAVAVADANSESLEKDEPECEPPMRKNKPHVEKDNQVDSKQVVGNGDTVEDTRGEDPSKTGSHLSSSGTIRTNSGETQQNEKGEQTSEGYNIDLQRGDSQSSSDDGKDELTEKLKKKNEIKKMLNIIFCSSIPMIGFGFMDQFIMIRLGDIFDASIGVSLGISTLCAASFGQLCSDTFGVFFGYVLNYLLQTYRVIQPAKFDIKNKVYQHCTLVGSVVGILLGCALGMLQLIFIDTTKSERLKKKKELDFIFQMVMCDCSNILNCETSTLFLYDKAKNELWSKAIHGRKNIIKISANSNEKSFNLWVLRNKEIINCKDVVNNELYNPSHDEKFNFKTRTILAAPILDRNNEVVGVLMFLNKLRSHGGYFTRNDEKLAEMMSKHISIFMEKFNYISEGDKKMIIFDKEKNISREGEEEEEEEADEEEEDENPPPVPKNSLNHNQEIGALTREHTHEGNKPQSKHHAVKERKRKRTPPKNLHYQISQIDEDDKIFDEGSENANIKQFDEYYDEKTEEEDDVYDDEDYDEDEEDAEVESQAERESNTEVENPAEENPAQLEEEEMCKASQPSRGPVEKEQTDKLDEKSREIINLLPISKTGSKKNEQPVNDFLVEDHFNHRVDHLSAGKNISKEWQSDEADQAEGADRVDCKVEVINRGHDQGAPHKLSILSIDKKVTDPAQKEGPSSFGAFNSGGPLPVSSPPHIVPGRTSSENIPGERNRGSVANDYPRIDRSNEGEKEPTTFDMLSIAPNAENALKSHKKGNSNLYENNSQGSVNLGNKWKKLIIHSLSTMLSDDVTEEGEGIPSWANAEVSCPHVDRADRYGAGSGLGSGAGSGASGQSIGESSAYNGGVAPDYTYYYDIEHTSDYGNLYVKNFSSGVGANDAFENERKKEQNDSIESYHRGYNSAILSETLCRNSSLSVASGIKEEPFRRYAQNYVYAKGVSLRKAALLEGAANMYSSSAYNSEKYFSHIQFAKIFKIVSEKKMNIKNFKILKNIYKYNLSKIFSNHYKYIIVKKKKKLRKFCYTLKHFDICKLDHFWFNIYCQNELKKIFFRNLHFIIDLHNTRIVDFKLINNYILHKIYENTTVSRLAPSTCYNIKIIDFFFKENLYLLNKSTMNDIIYKYIIFYYCRKKLRKKNFNYYNYQDMYLAENFFGHNTHTKKVPKILDEDLGKKSAIVTVDR